jgi:ubiquinone/menaquinone biosynthesis C-methylase UbiE
VAELAGLRDGSHILDIGCGPGLEAEELLKLRELAYVGVDISYEATRFAKIRLKHHHAVFLSADACALPIASPMFDCALFMLSLHQMSHRQTALAEAYSTLRPGGKLIVVTLEEQDWTGLVEFRCFPGLSAIQRSMSFTAKEALEHLRQLPSAREPMSVRTLYERRMIDLTHVVRVENRFFSALQHLDRHSLELGLKNLREVVSEGAFLEDVWCTIAAVTRGW